MEECSCEIAVSYLEVYNETIVDLINQSSGPLAIRDDGSNAINIPGLSIHKPSGSSTFWILCVWYCKVLYNYCYDVRHFFQVQTTF